MLPQMNRFDYPGKTQTNNSNLKTMNITVRDYKGTELEVKSGGLYLNYHVCWITSHMTRQR